MAFESLETSVRGLWSFDNDGTLTGLTETHTQVYADVMIDFQRRHKVSSTKPYNVVYAEAEKMIGRSIMQTATHLLRFVGMIPDEQKVKEIGDTYQSEFLKIVSAPDFVVPILPGVEDFLNYLKKNGQHIALITGNPRRFVDAVLGPEKAGLLAYFSILGLGDNARNKQEIARRAVNEALQKRLRHKYRVVVGDARSDVEGALHIEAFSVGVETGTTTGKELFAAGAQLVIPDITHYGKIVKAVNAMYGAGLPLPN